MVARWRDTRTGLMGLALAFAAGFISVLVFHQAMLAILHGLGVTPGVPWQTTPVPPLGIPQVISSAFWGGLGVLCLRWCYDAPAAPPLTGSRPWCSGLSLSRSWRGSWWPLKGQPIAGGWQPLRLLTGLLVNGAWGLGTALLFPSPQAGRARTDGARLGRNDRLHAYEPRSP